MASAIIAASIILSFAIVIAVAVLKGWENMAFIFGVVLLFYGCNMKMPEPMSDWPQYQGK